MIVDKYHVKNLAVVTTQALDRDAVKLVKRNKGIAIVGSFASL